MKKKLFGVAIIIIVILMSINAYKDGRKITLPENEITSGYVLNRRIGGVFHHDLSSEEIMEFVSFFNSCNITQRDRKKISLKHTALSDSIDVILQMNDSTEIYFMAFLDGEIYVNDHYSDKGYSLYNKKLLNYIWSMSEYITPEDFKSSVNFEN